MNVLINGKQATVVECTKLMSNNCPTNLQMDEFHDYEENIEWTNLEIQYGDDTLLIPEGYTGLWELASFDKMTVKAQMELSNDLLDWLKYEFNY